MDRTKGAKVPVQIRVNMWMGLSVHEKKFNSYSEGTFSVFAELVRQKNPTAKTLAMLKAWKRDKITFCSTFSCQYENQAQVFGKWGTTGLVGRHKFSDVTGKLKLKHEYFIPPRGWEWEDDWFIDPEKA